MAKDTLTIRADGVEVAQLYVGAKAVMFAAKSIQVRGKLGRLRDVIARCPGSCDLDPGQIADLCEGAKVVTIRNEYAY